MEKKRFEVLENPIIVEHSHAGRLSKKGTDKGKEIP
jgi:hypothetical protein